MWHGINLASCLTSKKNSGKMKEKFDFKKPLKQSFYLLVVCLLFVDVLKNCVLEDNQRDIDQRLTRLEQNECKTDSTIVKLYQKCNESLWELMWVRRDIKKLQNERE